MSKELTDPLTTDRYDQVYGALSWMIEQTAHALSCDELVAHANTYLQTTEANHRFAVKSVEYLTLEKPEQ